MPTDEPTDADLDAIEHEWPLIDAELGLLDAEIAMLNAEGPVSELDWRRLRRAEARVLAAAAALRRTRPTSGQGEAAAA